MDLDKVKEIERYTNMDSWLKEKSDNVIKYLSYLVEVLKKNEDSIPKEVCDDIYSYLYPTLIDSTKLYGFIYNAKEQSGREGELIFNAGQEGLEEVMAKFGLIQKSARTKKADELEELIIKLEELIIGDKYNRTFVHEALANYQNRAIEVKNEIQRLENSIEKVTIGESNWETFIFTAEHTIPKLKSELSNMKSNGS